MKNKDIIALVDYGFGTITTHSLVASAAYSVYKVKKAIINAAMSLVAMEESFLKESGIDNTAEFNQNLANLRRTGKAEEIKAEEEKLKRYNDLRRTMMEDETELPASKLIRYEEWRKLQDENKSKKINGREVDILSGEAEMLLENILWAPPKEDE